MGADLPLMIAHAAPIVGRDVKPDGGWTPPNARVIIGEPVVAPNSDAGETKTK